MNTNEKALAALKDIVDCSKGPYVQNPKPFLIEALISCNELASSAIAELESQPVTTHTPAGQVGEDLTEGDFVEVVLNKRLGCKLEPGKFCFEFVRFADFNIVVLRDSLTKAEWQPYKSEIDSIRKLKALRQPVETVGEVVEFNEARFKSDLFHALYDGFGFIDPDSCETISETTFAILKNKGYLRTQPQASVVEVPSGHAEFVHKLYEIRNEPDKLNAIVMREHAILSRTGGR